VWRPVAIALPALTLVACTPTSRDDLAGAWELHVSPEVACGFKVADLPPDVVIPIGSTCRNEGLGGGRSPRSTTVEQTSADMSFRSGTTMSCRYMATSPPTPR
jgi:hypothetical protein